MAKSGTENRSRRKINLALQGGGAHGAFTWGVLDKLLEDGRFRIEGVSGTSAGAMNAVVMADGFHKAGAEGAREKLYDFWRAVGRHWRFSPIQRTAWDVFMGNWSLDASPGFRLFDVISRFSSPYDFNPLNVNPLLDILNEEVKFSRVRACTEIRIFLAATNVHSGKVRVFETPEMSAEVVMASACLPHLFQAVEIDGVPYWDGGYMGNPALFPFFSQTETEDILLIQINPIERAETPRTAREILNRLDEITFNASLLREFRAIEFVGRLIDEGKLNNGEYKKIRMHRIAADEALRPLSASSKFNTEWQFLTLLRDIGRAAAEDWLELESDKVGVEPGLILEQEIAYRVDGAPAGPTRPHMRRALERLRRTMGWAEDVAE
ncbi:MAG TPA: patatin-like phospholipase family protein [Afifellaceae bacterium]|nr:patatin-like phospholipase family protein [Afifellaceae bacterium]